MRTLLVIALIGVTGVSQMLFAQSPAASPASPAKETYVAYRSTAPMTAAARDQLLRDAAAAGLERVDDSALERQGLFVFKAGDPAGVDKASVLFDRMLRVPVHEFRGVLSVSTGNFYLRFKNEVPLATARSRVQALGFKVLTPQADRSSLLVVEGTGKPADRERELNRLKQLKELLFVAPNDIPLQVPAAPVR